MKVSIVFFRRVTTVPVLHTIDNIELKLDFAKLKIANQIAISVKKKKTQLDIFPKSHKPTH